MNTETDNKIETILISAVNRLYAKEQNVGLDFEDLKCLEILYKIKKEAITSTSSSAITTASPENLIDLLRAVKGFSNDRRE